MHLKINKYEVKQSDYLNMQLQNSIYTSYKYFIKKLLLIKPGISFKFCIIYNNKYSNACLKSKQLFNRFKKLTVIFYISINDNIINNNNYNIYCFIIIIISQ